MFFTQVHIICDELGMVTTPVVNGPVRQSRRIRSVGGKRLSSLQTLLERPILELFTNPAVIDMSNGGGLKAIGCQMMIARALGTFCPTQIAINTLAQLLCL